MSSKFNSNSHNSGRSSISCPQEEKRYLVTEDGSGTWQIIDVATGLPAATNGKEFTQLAATDADEIAEELNECDAKGTKSPLL